MSSFDFDLFVIGAGSGGVRASRVAASHGARVAVAEEYRVGGTCVIRGCVPKKLLIYGAHFAGDLADASRFGWEISDYSFDWSRLRDNVQAEVARLESLYSQTLSGANVEIFGQRAEIVGPNQVRLATGQVVTTRYILVATGATPALPLIPGHQYGVSSNEIFKLEKLPKRIVIVGGGYIAAEFAGIFREFGTDVTVINRSGTILRGYDDQIRDRFLQISAAKGIEYRLQTEAKRIDPMPDGSFSIELIAQADPINCDLVLFAIGRRPNTEGLGLHTAGVKLDPSGAILVGEDNQTQCSSIYAVGDVTNRIQLTPVAIREGQAFADTVFGGSPHRVDYGNVPAAVFSNPPLAGVGLTEAQARLRFGSCKVYVSDFRPMKHVLAGRDERALYKMVVHPDTDTILGIHMIGPDAPEILQIAAVAVKAGLSKQSFDNTIALHPTMAEELVLLR